MNLETSTAAPPNADTSAKAHRSFVGPEANYDVFSAVQFNLLTHLGLREQHSLLDIGCGSLRAGRLFIPYLLPGGYCGVEPEQWLLESAINDEVGADLIRLKKPQFIHNPDFAFDDFGRKFDFLLAHSIFSHARGEDIGRCLESARRVMHDRSLFAATFVEGETDYAGNNWTLWAEYTYAFIEGAAKRAGLCCTRIAWPSPDMQQWVIFHLPGNDQVQRFVAAPAGDAGLLQQLDFCRQRLDRLQRHPYMRLGLFINRALKWGGFAYGRLLRSLRGK